jgi:hypothetical protein
MIIRVSNHADRIRLIAIENRKGAFGNGGALRFLLGHRWAEAGFFAQKRKHLLH